MKYPSFRTLFLNLAPLAFSSKACKKYFGLTLLLLLFSPSLYTQTEERGPIFQKLSFRLGAGGFWQNNSPRIASLFIYGHDSYTGSSSLGWSVNLDIELNQQVGFSTGFRSSGATIAANLDELGIWGEAIFPYFRTTGFDMKGWEIPMSLRLYFLKGKRIRPYVNLTVGINRMTYLQRAGEYVDPQEPSENYSYFFDEETQWNLSYAGGAGVYVDITDKLSFAVDLAYQRAELYYFHTNDEFPNTARGNGSLLEFAILRPVASAGLYFEILAAKRKE